MQIRSLKEVCSLITKGTTPTSLGMKLNEGNINFIKVECLSEDGNIISSKMQKIDETTHNKLNRSKLHEGDILYSIAGSIGRMTVVDSSILPANTNQAVAILRPIKELINTQYLFYFLKDTKSQKNAMRRIVQSVQTNLSLGELSSLEVSIPSLPIQIAIGNFINNLDAKIAVNNALSKTLEDIAQTIFKSWFIDFDPVKAKMAGEKPAGMDAATAALFPESMEESELGLIPKGWEVRSLDEISEYLNGLAMQKFPVIDENEQLPVIKIAQLRAGNTQGADMASGLLDPKFIIKDGDILFSWSGTLEVETWTGGSGALNQHLFKVTGKSVPDWYSYLSTKSFLSFFREIANGKATTMGHIQRGHLSESKLAIPNLELLNRATEIIEPIISLKIKTSIESRNLAEIRDSLLPRLISGELQIPEEMLAS
jgi:type I restriction enzyme, S subunit